MFFVLLTGHIIYPQAFFYIKASIYLYNLTLFIYNIIYLEQSHILDLLASSWRFTNENNNRCKYLLLLEDLMVFTVYTQAHVYK